MTVRFLCGTSVLAASFAMFTASGAAAQVAPETPAESDVIVITGSYIRGTPEDAALPVDVFSSDELEAAGVDSPLEFIKDLPSVGSVTGETNQFGSAQAAQGVGTINLRSLGSTRSLVLMNGRRTITPPGSGSVDTNLIPLFALQRVEILKDGAASTYGSDAIAGVANFITRPNFDGIEVNADYTFVDGSDGNYQTSILFGKSFDRGNFLIGAGWQHRSELRAIERDYTQLPYEVNSSGFSALSNPGGITPRFNSRPLGFGIDGNSVDACEALGGYATSICYFNYVPFANLIEDEDRYQVFSQLDVDLTDRLSFHVDGLYAQTDWLNNAYSPSFPPTQGPNGPGFLNAFSVPRSNPGFEAFLDQTFSATSPANLANNAGLTYWRPFGFGGNPRDENGASRGLAQNVAYRLSGGLEYELSDTLRAELFGTYIDSTRRFFTPGILGSRLQAALNGFGGANCDPATGSAGVGSCMYLNPFVNAYPVNPATGAPNPAYVPGNENSAELVEWLQIPNGTVGKEDSYVVDAVISGETGLSIAGGPEVAFAAGAQYRNRNFSSRPYNVYGDSERYPCPELGETECDLEIGPFVFLGNQTRSNFSQDVHALFAEVKVPVGDMLEFTGAVRYEDYGDPIGSTTNPKLSARFQPLEWLTLRGSIGTTFRGPLPQQVIPSGGTALVSIAAAGNNFKPVDGAGNPDLRPETALTYNAGVILDYAGATFTVDYWVYELDDTFDSLPAQAIATSAASGAVSSNGTNFIDCSSPLIEYITFQGGCVQGTTTGLDIARIQSQTVNGPSVRTSGFDFALNYGFDLGPAAVTLGANASYVLEYKTDDFVINDVFFDGGYNAVGFANYDRSPGTLSDWKGNAYASFRYEGLNLRYQFKFINGVYDDRCFLDPDACTFAEEVEAFYQHDFIANYDLPLAFADIQLQAAVENIFDTDPSAARLELGYDPFIGSPIGRTFRLGVRANF